MADNKAETTKDQPTEQTKGETKDQPTEQSTGPGGVTSDGRSYVWVTADHVTQHQPSGMVAVDPDSGDLLDPQPAQPKASEPEARAAGYDPEAEKKALDEAGDAAQRNMHQGKPYEYK